AERGDAIPDHADVAVKSGPAGTIDDAPVPDQEVVGHVGAPSWRRVTMVVPPARSSRPVARGSVTGWNTTRPPPCQCGQGPDTVPFSTMRRASAFGGCFFGSWPPPRVGPPPPRQATLPPSVQRHHEHARSRHGLGF